MLESSWKFHVQELGPSIIVQKQAEYWVTRNVKISKLAVLPLEVHLTYLEFHVQELYFYRSAELSRILCLHTCEDQYVICTSVGRQLTYGSSYLQFPPILDNSETSM